MNKEQQNWHKLAKEYFETEVKPLCTVKTAATDSFSEDWQTLFGKMSSDQSLAVCKDHPIPEGFVIVGQTTSVSCSIALNNAWLIKKPAEKETICKVSPIPEGYVIIGQTINFHCSHELYNAWIIKKPGEEESICKSSPIPAGYVIVGKTTNFGCSHELNNAWMIKRV